MDKQLSQADLAKAMSVNQRTISKKKKSVRQPDFETLVSIAKYFDVTCGYLVGVEEY